jgi:hypothetical protein
LIFVSVLGLTLLPLANIRVLRQIAPLHGIKSNDIARHAQALLMSAFSRSSLRGRTIRPKRR